LCRIGFALEREKAEGAGATKEVLDDPKIKIVAMRAQMIGRVVDQLNRILCGIELRSARRETAKNQG